MKREIVVLILVLSLCAEQVHAGGWMEGKNKFVEGEVLPQIHVMAYGRHKLDAFVYADVEKGYAEAYAGPVFTPNPSCQLGVGIGLEQGSDTARLGWFAYAERGRASALLIGEHGGASGDFYIAHAKLALGKSALGVMHQSFAGTGIRFDQKVGPITVWGAWLSERSLAGVRYWF